MEVNEKNEINIKEINDLKKWIEYESEAFIEKVHILNDEQLINTDAVTYCNIRILEEYLKNECKQELTEDKETIIIDDSHKEETQRLLKKIPNLDVEKFADLKLTEKEKDFCKIRHYFEHAFSRRPKKCSFIIQ